MFVFQGQSPRTGRMLLLPSLLLLTLLTRMAHSSFWTTGNAGSSRMGGRSPSRALAFMGSKRKISGLSLPGNGTASFLTTGSSVLHIHNSNVTLLSLDSNTLPLQARGGLNTNSTGSGGVVGLSSGTAATSSGGRGLGGARGQGLAGQGGGALDQLAGEALQTIGGALFEATCFYIASRIIMGVRNLCGRTFVKPTGVKFSDVIGVDEAKQEVQELVEYLKEPMRYKKLGAKIPRGILLVGPPGVGKTMLARAIAGEASCPFYYASGSDFANPYWGESAGRGSRHLCWTREDFHALFSLWREPLQRPLVISHHRRSAHAPCLNLQAWVCKRSRSSSTKHVAQRCVRPPFCPSHVWDALSCNMVGA